MENILVYIQSRITINSVLEVLIIAFMLYKLLMWLKGTQAEQVFKGLVTLLFLGPISQWLGFTTIRYIVTSASTWAFIIFVVVFQPELRSALEKLGNTRFYRQFVNQSNNLDTHKNIRNLINAVNSMSNQRIGALIVCERETRLKNIMETGVELQADISKELIENIFTPKRPLHDGAMIVNFYNNKIMAAGCLLPLSDNHNLSSDLGTRHRAGLGMSERSDALTIIVSEETGIISYTEGGILIRKVQGNDLEEILKVRFEPQGEDADKGVFRLWGRKNEEK